MKSITAMAKCKARQWKVTQLLPGFQLFIIHNSFRYLFTSATLFTLNSFPFKQACSLHSKQSNNYLTAREVNKVFRAWFVCIWSCINITEVYLLVGFCCMIPQISITLAGLPVVTRHFVTPPLGGEQRRACAVQINGFFF